MLSKIGRKPRTLPVRGLILGEEPPFTNTAFHEYRVSPSVKLNGAHPNKLASLNIQSNGIGRNISTPRPGHRCNAMAAFAHL